MRRSRHSAPPDFNKINEYLSTNNTCWILMALHRIRHQKRFFVLFMKSDMNHEYSGIFAHLVSNQFDFCHFSKKRTCHFLSSPAFSVVVFERVLHHDGIHFHVRRPFNFRLFFYQGSFIVVLRRIPSACSPRTRTTTLIGWDTARPPATLNTLPTRGPAETAADLSRVGVSYPSTRPYYKIIILSLRGLSPHHSRMESFGILPLNDF